MTQRRVLTVIMDGIGMNPKRFGNAVALAYTPTMHFLQHHSLFTSLLAHGKAVGLPSDADMGNSEVGHNALGAGKIYDQGAKLVENAIAQKSLFRGATWCSLVNYVKEQKGALHFIGLLSDGNVHSHQNHLYAMMQRAYQEGVGKIRVHVLLDGRDVPPKSAETYVDALETVLKDLRAAGCDAKVASGGGRMTTTMDRYDADWSMVERGWKAHVLGKADHAFSDLTAAVQHFRKDINLTDQNFPSFVIRQNDQAVGPIQDGDGVVFFNFRGDRSIEISKAFDDDTLTAFERERRPKVFYAGMMEYDGDLHIPRNYLVSPPLIRGTLGEYLAQKGLRQYACSETQKYGHVTYFWNGNRSGYFDQRLEEYVEVPSDNIQFNEKPWMKAYEITEATIKRMLAGSFDFGRINFPNGDMVGHTGDLAAAVVAVETVDLMLRKLIGAADESDTILLITADHGNCDEMFDDGAKEFEGWEYATGLDRPRGKTSHTLNQVPCYLYDPRGTQGRSFVGPGQGGLANLANTALDLLGLGANADFLPSLLKKG